MDVPLIRDRYEKNPGTMVRTLMLAIVVAALGLRVAGIPWQLPWHFHPDESNVVDGAAHAVIRGNLGAVLSPIRPFEALIVGELALLHPLIPMTMESSSAGLAAASGADLAAASPAAYLLSRGTVAVFGALTVLLLMLATRELVGLGPAVIAGIILSLSFAHVRESRFATPMVPGLFFAAGSLWMASRYLSQGGVGWFAGASLAAALAMMFRDILVIAWCAPLSALVLRLALFPASDSSRPDRQSLALGGVLLASATWVHQLYAIAGTRNFQNLTVEPNQAFGAVVATVSDLPVAVLYLGSLAQSLGPVTVPLAAAGAIFMARRNLPGTLLLGVVLFVAAVMPALQNRHRINLGLPMELPVAAFAGYAIVWIGQSVWATRWRALPMTLTLVALAYPTANVLRSGWIQAQPDTRVQARQWLEGSLPTTSSVRTTHFGLPSASTAYVTGERVSISSILLDDVPHEITGQGCGEVIALESPTLSSYRRVERPVVESSRQMLAQLGASLMSISPDPRSDSRPFTSDDGHSPFWNLFQVDRPGPPVEILQVAPPCAERPPLHEANELLAVASIRNSGTITRLLDARFHTQSTVALTSSASLGTSPQAVATGRFRANDPGRQLVTVSNESLRRDERAVATLRILQLADGLPPQSLIVDREVLRGRARANLIAPVDLDGDGVDELGVLVRQDQHEHIEVYRVDQTRLVLLERIDLDMIVPDGVDGIAGLAPDRDTAPGSIAVIGPSDTHLRLRVLEWIAARQTFALRGGTVPYVNHPRAVAQIRPSLALTDVDGDGRNELALFDSIGGAIDIFKIGGGRPRDPARLSLWSRRPLMAGTELITTTSAASWATPAFTPSIVAFQSLANRPLLTFHDARDTQSLVQAQAVEVPPRNEVQALTLGRFWPSTGGRLALLLRQEGRQQFLDAWPVDDAGHISGPRVTLDRWRAERTDRALDEGLVAMDLDGDGQDELGIAYQRGTIQELRMYRLKPDRSNSMDQLAVVSVPGTDVGQVIAMAGIRAPGAARDALALLIQTGGQRSLQPFEMNSGSGQLTPIAAATAVDTRLTSLASLAEGSTRSATLLVLGRDEATNRFVQRQSLSTDGRFQSDTTSPWHVLDDRAILWAGWR